MHYKNIHVQDFGTIQKSRKKTIKSCACIFYKLTNQIFCTFLEKVLMSSKINVSFKKSKKSNAHGKLP